MNINLQMVVSAEEMMHFTRLNGTFLKTEKEIIPEDHLVWMSGTSQEQTVAMHDPDLKENLIKPGSEYYRIYSSPINNVILYKAAEPSENSFVTSVRDLETGDWGLTFNGDHRSYYIEILKQVRPQDEYLFGLVNNCEFISRAQTHREIIEPLLNKLEELSAALVLANQTASMSKIEIAPTEEDLPEHPSDESPTETMI